jgi:hypothetical protein
MRRPTRIRAQYAGSRISKQGLGDRVRSGHPIMFGYPIPAQHFAEFSDPGGYPLGFVGWALRLMECSDPSKVLHLCSGSMQTGVRVDVRADTKPDVVADCRQAPFADHSFRWILADPPYSEEYAEALYGTRSVYPGPGQITQEAARLLEPGGFFGLLHHVVCPALHGLELRNIYGVITGMGYAIRAFTLLQAPQPRLWGAA